MKVLNFKVTYSNVSSFDITYSYRSLHNPILSDSLYIKGNFNYFVLYVDESVEL